MPDNLPEEKRLRILFLCTGNSCRSQMAEGWTKQLRGDRIRAFSAGVRADGMNPLTVRVMKEAGVDISDQWSKAVNEVLSTDFDFVITLCGHARETCPVFPGVAKVVHHGFEDPVVLVESLENEDEKLGVYRRIRDEIREYVLTLPESIEDSAGAGEKPVISIGPVAD